MKRTKKKPAAAPQGLPILCTPSLVPDDVRMQMREDILSKLVTMAACYRDEAQRVLEETHAAWGAELNARIRMQAAQDRSK